ncbi:MAG: SRPBCC family protein [Methylobacteriaceae bacterium]|nr:SRPBCC family protein [Methylobacteriaceae bacterium]MBV9395788.1 SRPBCC family protein [Methylobacteriaceae bacterium]
MASIHKEMYVAASPDHVWAAFRDVGAVDTRLARGFVTDVKLEGDTRVVRFANGVVARERIIDMDDARRRLAYSVVEGRPTHHHATFEVFAEGPGSRVVWITDLLPNELKPAIDDMMEHGMSAMKSTLEGERQEDAA